MNRFSFLYFYLVFFNIIFAPCQKRGGGCSFKIHVFFYLNFNTSFFQKISCGLTLLLLHACNKCVSTDTKWECFLQKLSLLSERYSTLRMLAKTPWIQRWGPNLFIYFIRDPCHMSFFWKYRALNRNDNFLEILAKIWHRNW